MVRFSNAQVAEAIQPFWAALQRGEFIADAAVQAGRYRKRGTRWVAACGGVRPRRGRGLKGRCLCFSEREEIALARARGDSVRAIARRLGRSPSTVSRELRRNADRRGYRATTAHALAYERASRPKPAKLATNLALRRVVQDDLRRRCEKRARRLTLKVTVEQMKVVAATRQSVPIRAGTGRPTAAPGPAPAASPTRPSEPADDHLTHHRGGSRLGGRSTPRPAPARRSGALRWYDVCRESLATRQQRDILTSRRDSPRGQRHRDRPRWVGSASWLAAPRAG